MGSNGSLGLNPNCTLLRKRNILLHKFQQPNTAPSRIIQSQTFFLFNCLLDRLRLQKFRRLVRNMDSKGDDGSREMLLKLQEKIEKATSELKASGSSSASTSSHHLQKLSKEVQLLLEKTANAQDPSKPQIRDGNNLFNT